MILGSVFVILCIFVDRHVSFQLDKNFNKLYDGEWQCDSVCVGSGGKAEFDPKNKICKCTMDKNIDGINQALMLKNFDDLGIQLIITKDYGKNVAKRELDTAVAQPENSVVGQPKQQKYVTPRSKLSILPPSNVKRPTVRPTTSRTAIYKRKRTTTRRPIQIQQRLQEIQNKIDERRKNRSRNRPVPRLQQRAGFQDDSKPNLMERLREMQNEGREKRKNKKIVSTSSSATVGAAEPRVDSGIINGSQEPPIAAASHNEDSNRESIKEENLTNEKKIHQVITQPLSLY